MTNCRLHGSKGLLLPFVLQNCITSWVYYCLILFGSKYRTFSTTYVYHCSLFMNWMITVIFCQQYYFCQFSWGNHIIAKWIIIQKDDAMTCIFLWFELSRGDYPERFYLSNEDPWVRLSLYCTVRTIARDDDTCTGPHGSFKKKHEDEYCWHLICTYVRIHVYVHLIRLLVNFELK